MNFLRSLSKESLRRAKDINISCNLEGLKKEETEGSMPDIMSKELSSRMSNMSEEQA